MSNFPHSPHPSPNRWSARIADRYQCRLSPVLADWFDRETWKQTGCGEFREPVAPELLLTPAPEVIWPGFMCCNLLPLVGNMAGDWLCARMDQNDCLTEIVQWYHGGGDWIPWGRNLAEALVFDAALDRIPGASRRHAVPAENPRPATEASQLHADPLLQWALSHVPTEVASQIDRQSEGHELVRTLLQSQVAEVAVRCELVVSLLTHWPRDVLSELLQTEALLDRSRLVEWAFDLDHMPDEYHKRLTERAGVAACQDWATAADHAARVCQIAPDLAWPWEIAGYAKERRADLPAAIRDYHQAAKCSVFSDQSIRLDSHWASDQSAKFSVARLAQLCPEQVAESTYLRLLHQPDARQRRREATAWWMEQASRLSDNHQHAQAHDCYVAAAWDLGAEPISIYADLLERIANSAKRSNQSGRTELASTHRRCLQERYGL